MVNNGENVAAPAQSEPSTVSNEIIVAKEQSAVSAQPSQEVATQAQDSAEEKVLKQSEVNKIVAREKREAAEKARKEALLEIEQRAWDNAQSQQSQIDSGQVEGDKPLTRSDLVKMQQDAAKKAQESFVKDVQSTFAQKLDSFQKEDGDFTKEVMSVLPGDIIYNAPLMHGLNGLDNAKDVMREMANHPTKYEDIQAALRHNPQWGLQRLYALSASIKANKDAMSKPTATPPLDQIKPSPTGKDIGKLSVSEQRLAMRRDPRYRV